MPISSKLSGLRGHISWLSQERWLLRSSHSLSACGGHLLRFGESMRSYSVPDFRLTLNVGSHYSPGYFRDALWIKRQFVQPFSLSFLDQADNPSRLVLNHDDSDVSSCAYPYSTVLDGIPRWVQGYRLSFPLHGLRISRYRGERASPRHRGDRACTCTEIKLSKICSI